MKINSETEMLALGKRLGEWFLTETVPKLESLSLSSEKSGPSNSDDLKFPHVIELIGDVGAGKTTLVRGLAEGLGIKEPIMSPSFTISKTYAFLSHGQPAVLSHYDFYRLDDPGIMVEDLNEAISAPNSLVVVEWGGIVADLLPEDRLSITIKLENDGAREVKTSLDGKNAHLLNSDPEKSLKGRL